MKIEYVEWSNLKTRPGVWGYEEDNKMFYPFKDDGNRRYRTSLYKPDAEVSGTDTKDFVDNFKPDIDQGIFVVDPRSTDNLPLIALNS